MTKLNTILASWKTTILGIGAVCAALSDGFQMTDLAALTAAVGLVFAKDSDKTNTSLPVKTQLVD